MKKLITITLLSMFVLILAGCGEYRNVPPQCVGRKLTQTGWENRLYGPGQVDIGKTGWLRRAYTKLVVMQTSAFTVKEGFLGSQAMEDKEDHRVFTADHTPMTLDIRLMFTCPDIKNDEEAVKRLFTLGNPSQDPKDERVMQISLESIYNEQARMHVRGKIRDICGEYVDFNTSFTKREEINRQTRNIVVSVLKERNVPIMLLDSQISNMKPDPLVWENQVKIQAAEAEIEAMRKLQRYLDENPTARLIFISHKLKEIASIAAERGNTVVVISALGGEQLQGNTIVLPATRQKAEEETKPAVKK